MKLHRIAQQDLKLHVEVQLTDQDKMQTSTKLQQAASVSEKRLKQNHPKRDDAVDDRKASYYQNPSQKIQQTWPED